MKDRSADLENSSRLCLGLESVHLENRTERTGLKKKKVKSYEKTKQNSNLVFDSE